MSQTFEETGGMPLQHPPDGCKLHVQGRRAEHTAEKDVRLHVATSSAGVENGERVWNGGFSILESVPWTVAMLQNVAGIFGQDTSYGGPARTIADLAS